MPGHELWHVTVLAVTLFGGAGLVIVLLAPLIFEVGDDFARWRHGLLAIFGVAAALLVLEWLVVH